MAKKVFIDGSSGTTGLRISQRLKNREDIELINISEEKRKDVNARKNALNSADVAILCLPDDAAREAVSFVTNPNTKIIDTSTAHRTQKGWTYGFPEVCGLREKIKKSNRIANPGCHASGFVALIAPLVENNLIKKDAKLSCFSITGFSGGGKKMIEQYTNDVRENKNMAWITPRVYSLSQGHKHLPEMQKVCGLDYAPLFTPVVSSFYEGMVVEVQLFKDQIKASLKEIQDFYKKYYTQRVIKYLDIESIAWDGFLRPDILSELDNMIISASGNEERYSLYAIFDNLGKGASGAAIQNLNLAIGADEYEGMILSMLNVPNRKNKQ